MHSGERKSHPADERCQGLGGAASSKMRDYLREHWLPDKKVGLIKDHRHWVLWLIEDYVLDLGGRASQVLRDEESLEREGEWAERVWTALDQMAEKSDPRGIEALLGEEVKAVARETLGSSRDIDGLVAGMERLKERDEEKMGKVWDRLPILVDSLDELDGKDLVLLGVAADGLFRRCRQGRLVPTEAGRELLKNYGALGKALISLGVLKRVASRIPTHVQRPLWDFEES